MLQFDFIDRMQFSSCKFHVELGTAYVFTMESLSVSVFTIFSSLLGARTSICPDKIDFVWCALLLSTGKVGARISVCPEVTDFGWCALSLGCCGVLTGVFRLLVTSESAIVEGARVLTTIEVPRAASGQVGSGSGGAQRFKSSMCTYIMRASASICIPTTHSMGARTILYGPIHGEHNLFFLAGG